MRLLFLLVAQVLAAQDEGPAPPPSKPVGVKITRPGVIGVANMPPVGGTLVVYGYSWETPTAGFALHGLTSYYEHTFQKRLALSLSLVAPLERGGKSAIGDTSPGVKFRLVDEGYRRPLVSATYSIKVPLAPVGFGTGRYDHKVSLAADKSIGHTRWTANAATTFAAQRNGTFVRQYMTSLSAVTRWHRRWGTVLQSYWTTAGRGYGGVVAAPFVQVNNAFNFFAGTMRNLGPCPARYGMIAGFNYLHRPRPRVEALR